VGALQGELKGSGEQLQGAQRQAALAVKRCAALEGHLRITQEVLFRVMQQQPAASGEHSPAVSTQQQAPGCSAAGHGDDTLMGGVTSAREERVRVGE
jgi:hypothetical protein